MPHMQPIEITVYPQATDIYIDVRDFGAGVANQDLHQLFQPFFSTEINGTGLGLYLSHSFCEANQAQADLCRTRTRRMFQDEMSTCH